MYIDGLETYVDKVDKDSPCLIFIVVVLYANDDVLLSKSSASLQRLLIKLYDCCTSNLYGKFSKTKIITFGYTKWKLGHKAFYLGKD